MIRSVLNGLKIQMILPKNEGEIIEGHELQEYHRSCPRVYSVCWNQNQDQKIPELWNSPPSRSAHTHFYRMLMQFDRANQDLMIQVDGAVGKSDVYGEGRSTSLVAGTFIAKSYHQVIVSSWGMAWWDDDRLTTSYVASFSMMRWLRHRV